MPQPHTVFEVHGILLGYGYAVATVHWSQAGAGHPVTWDPQQR